MKTKNSVITLLFAVFVFSAGELLAGCPISETNPEQQLHVTGRIHFNINVSDFDKAKRFYRTLGFVDQVGPFPETNSIEVSNGVGLDDLYKMRAELIYLGKLPEGPVDLTVPTGRFIDIIEWMEPTRLEPPYTQINHLGISYFSLFDDDILALGEQLEEAGGTDLTGPVQLSSGAQQSMIKDPDGTYIALHQSAGKTAEVDYLNVNVTDLECSKKFYAMLGLEEGERSAVSDSNLLYKALGIDADIDRAGVRLNHRVDGSKIRLSEWASPVSQGPPYPAPINHLGLQRINWGTTDLEADIALLKSRGVKFLSDIAPCCEGDASTFGFIIFEDPDGIYNQLMGSITPPAIARAESNER